MNRFLKDYKKYHAYVKYASKAELKSEVASSYLTWLWWILDPLFFMLIYTFIVEIVFSTSVPKLPVFVMCGITIWNFFNKNLVTCVKIIRSNRAIISQKYIPKFMLVVEKLYVNSIKFVISFMLLVLMAILFRVDITYNILYIIPLVLLLLVLSFGLSNILAHFGVFIEDSANILQIILRLVFYLSGIFYSISDRLPQNLVNVMLKTNPIAYIIEDFRNVFMYGTSINYSLYLYWLLISIIISVISVKLIYKYENSYAKVM